MSKDNLKWRMPTIEELLEMYKNLHLKERGGFTYDFYLSSSVNLSDDAWGQYFIIGDQFDNDKEYYIRVRVVRSFESKEGYKIGQETETGFVFDIQGSTVFECKKYDESGLMDWDELMKKFGGKK